MLLLNCMSKIVPILRLVKDMERFAKCMEVQIVHGISQKSPTNHTVGIQ